MSRASARFGVLPTLKVDNNVIAVLSSQLSDLQIPGDLECQIHISTVCLKYSSLLGQDETSPTGLLASPLPVVHTIDTELNVIQNRYSQTWSTATEIVFLGARLNLYAYSLNQSLSRSPTNTPRPHSSESEIVTIGSITATRLLQLACNSSAAVINGTEHTRHCVVYAVLFLLRISGPAQKSFIDEIAVRNAISHSWKLLASASRAESDHMSRVCSIIEYVSNHMDWSKDAPKDPGKPKSLMANNFIVDVVVRARERFAEAHGQNGNSESEAALLGARNANEPPLMWLDSAIRDPMLVECWQMFGMYGDIEMNVGDSFDSMKGHLRMAE